MSRVRIIHVSDLHLFVDRHGKRRKYTELAWSARLMVDMTSPVRRLPDIADLRIRLESLLSGIDTHSDTALEAMLATLDDLLAEPVPQVVIQTGDVSTFGALTSSDDVSFPEWQYWRDRVRKQREHRTKGWIDLFGNHDVWPGTLPILKAPCIERVVQALRDQFFPQAMPIVHRVALESFVLKLYAVNSVLAGPIANTFAVGELDRDAVDMTTPFEGAVEQLEALTSCICNDNETSPVIRGLLMHHPPHHFDKPGLDSSEGGLRDAERLGKWLEAYPVELVLAGHRHYVHPPCAVKQPPAQAPLPSRTLQLVCGSPTQESSSQRAPSPPRTSHEADVIPLRPRCLPQTRPSFSVYDLRDVGSKIQLERTVYEHASKAAYKFVATAADTFDVSVPSPITQSA